ncbi:MAG: RICIN domain-containing protein [Dysgonamonadaceae bacterium]|jgi:hypothetical protein|nr:RICIN domain-containing protein [Dysgonamonadaceae bacterium]
MKKLILLFVLYLSTGYLSAQNYIVNGSFEYGINVNWTHQVESPGRVDFILAAIDKSKAPMDGDFYLNVKTNRIGTTMRATSTTQMTTSADTLYLLRFWARGSVRSNANNEPSRIFVEIEGSETPGVLYEMHPGRTVFHLPFKAQPHTGLKIKFLYQDQNINYALDGVEVLGENNREGIDVLNTYIWQHKRTGNGWVAGDNDISYLLPDGRTVWFFNDSFIGDNDVTKNRMVNGGFVRNAVLVQDIDGTLNTLSGMTNVGGQTAYFQPPVSTYEGRPTLLWVGDAILLDNTLNVHLVEVYDDGGGNCVPTGKSYMGQFSYPELEYLGMVRRADFCSPYETYFVENGMLYSYKTETEWLARFTHVARTPIGNILGEEPWEFWNGSAWVNDETQSARINDMGSDGVIKLSEGNYAHVAMSGLDPSVWLSFAQEPQGPWTPKQIIYTHPDDSLGWWYMPNFHEPLANGNYSISYSTNYHYDWGHNALQSWIDKYWYRQHYIQVDLLGLSPYSKRDCAGVFFGEAYRDECNECVGGTTGKEPCTPPTVELPGGMSGLQGVYAIQNKQSGLYLSIQNQSRANGAWVEQASYTDDDSQKFELKAAGDNFYSITNVASKMLLSTAGFSKQPKANTEQWNGLDFGMANLGGLISSQHQAVAGYAVENLIDNLPATSFYTQNKPTWVQFNPATPQVAVKYSLTSSSESSQRDPKNWTLSGSNNQTDWVELDKVSNFAFSARMEERVFEIANPAAYSYYRLNVEPRLGNSLQLAEWKLLVATNPESEYYSKDFVVEDAGDNFVQFINRNSGLVLSAYEDGIVTEGALVMQLPDMKQAASLWKLIPATSSIETIRTEKSAITVYPNPVKQTLNLNMPSGWAGSRFVVYNVNGNAVYSGTAGQNAIEAGHLNAGYYVLKISKENDVFITYFIKQ